MLDVATRRLSVQLARNIPIVAKKPQFKFILTGYRKIGDLARILRSLEFFRR